MPTLQELKHTYSDPEWQKQFVQLADIVTLLRHCIIDARYKISDNMNNSIVLTEYGRNIQKELTTSSGVNAKDARIICTLELAHREPMVDLERTDFDALTKEISAQVRSGLIKYPLVFGRTLYDKAAQMFPTLRSRLSTYETRRLLEGTPSGVFQVGQLVTGPFGLLRSNVSRWFPPTTLIPLQHCSDIACDEIHSTWLSSDYDASINQNIPKIHKVIEADPDTAQAWSEFLQDMAYSEAGKYDDLTPAALPIIIGDCLTDDELTHLGYWLHEQDSAIPIRDQYLSLGIVQEQNVDLSQVDRAGKLQLIWLSSDDDILAAIDELIRTKKIAIDPGEIRTPRINRTVSGAFRVGASLGALGVQLTSSRGDLPPLRLQRLAGRLYDASNPEDKDEILWQLRQVDGPDLQTQLAEFLRVNDPESAIRTLVMARRRNVETALAELRMSEESLTDPHDPMGNKKIDDHRVVQRFLWKLGFNQPLLFRLTADFWKKHETMRRVARDASTNAAANIDDLITTGASFFVELERVLDDCVMFSWWALTNDHAASSTPYVYTQKQGQAAWNSLDEFTRSRNSGERLRLAEDRRTLWSLARSFALLSDLLADFRTMEDEYVRAENLFPSYFNKTELRKFPFTHIVPFLDLLPSSQDAIVTGLKSVCDTLTRSDVHNVRNELAHFQRTTLEIERLETALDGARRAVEKLEAMGLARMTFLRTRTTGDTWGRSSHILSGADGNELALDRPSPFSWIGFPRLREPQYLVISAVFAPPNEVLRFSQGSESGYAEMWAEYPKRRTSPEGLLTDGQESADDILRSSHYVLPSQR